MTRQLATIATAVALLGGGVLADAQKPAAGRPTTYDVAITVDGSPYTGTMVLAVAGSKVSGSMNITQPGEITGKAAGTVKAGEMVLEFPYHMVARKCDGDIRVNVKLPEKKDAGAKASGTVSIGGCGRPPDSRLAGTIELTPAAKK
jgi:phage tail sheath gpL-like